MVEWGRLVAVRELKIGFFGQFIGEKSVFGRHGNDFNKIKSKEKNRGKNREKFDFSSKNPTFSLFFPFSGLRPLVLRHLHYRKPKDRLAEERRPSASVQLQLFQMLHELLGQVGLVVESSAHTRNHRRIRRRVGSE